MCTPNYWVDIVETRDFHIWSDTDKDLRRKDRNRRKCGLPKDAPEWLVWRVLFRPPSNLSRLYRRKVRAKRNQTLRAVIARGDNLDDLLVESRTSRYNDRDLWW